MSWYFLLLPLLAVLASFIIWKYSLKTFSLSKLDISNDNIVNLSHGKVYYNRYGNKGDNTVVLIHGVFTPSFVWDNVANILSQSGNYVIFYDLYGRGYSDRVTQPYDENLYNTQLLELLDALKIEQPVDLIGYSLGGGIAASFTSKHPDRVKKMGLIAPPLLYADRTPLLLKVLLLPVIGDLLCHIIVPRFVINRQNKEYVNGVVPIESLHKVKEQFEFKGTVASFISTAKHYPYNSIKNTYKTVGNSHIPVLLIWGKEDKLARFENSKKIIEFIPEVEFHPIENAEHSVTYAKSDVVGNILVDFAQLEAIEKQ